MSYYSPIALILFCAVSLATGPFALAEDTLKQPPNLGAKSPEEAFERFLAAVRKDNWAEAFHVSTPESRDFFVGSLTAMGHLEVLGPEGVKIAARYADLPKLKEAINEMNELPPEQQQTIAPKISATVAKKADLIKEMLALFEMKKMENWINDLKAEGHKVDLERLKVKDDTATAKISITAPNRHAYEDTGFRKIEGRWYFDYQSQ